MADLAISQLPQVNELTPTDSFVLQQGTRAMRLVESTLRDYLLQQLHGHGGIQSISKTATNVLVDTYTITLADNTTYNFTVTNGKAISTISKTSTDGLVDTYTIAFNDGTSQTFDVTNGNGVDSIELTSTSGLVDTYTVTYGDETETEFTVTNGRAITSIVKTETDVLIDTYTISYNDNTTSTFDVVNGNGIASVDKETDGLVDTYTFTFTNGTDYEFYVTNAKSITNVALTDTTDLVDTYTIFFNDNTSTTFTVTNGEKGDKGDKGEKGDSARASVSVAYGKSDSLSNIPTSWSATIPHDVAQGQYLWTKITLGFSTGGTPTEYYTASRMGQDGSGTVSSVNGVSADVNNNIDLIYMDDEVETMLVIRRAT